MGEAEEVQVLLSIHTVDCSSWEDLAPQPGCPGALVVVRIPDSETEIGESAFKDCRSMGKLIIPESVSKIHAGGGLIHLMLVIQKNEVNVFVNVSSFSDSLD